MVNTDSPKQRATALLQEALATGIKGNNREAIQAALDVLQGKTCDLTDMAYRNLKPGSSLVDPARPGFMMRANKSGGRWFYRFSWDGKQIELPLGDYPETGLADARNLWQQARTIRLKGSDPRATLAGADQAGKDVLTFGELQSRYLELAEKHKRSWRGDMATLNRHIPREWRDRPAASITADDIAAVLQKAGVSRKDGTTPTPREAEKVRAVLNTLFNLALARGKVRTWLASKSAIIRPWLTAGINPVEATALPKRTAATFQPEEKHLRAFLTNLDSIEHDDTRVALLFQLLTNSRAGEVAGLTWDEIDLQARTWTLPAERSKNKESHKVMLPKQAAAILTEQVDKHGENGLVFKSPTGKALNNTAIAHAISDHRKALKIPAAFTSHALRHYGQTWLASAACPVEVRDRVSNHKPPATSMSAHYNAHQYDAEAREWLQRLADHVSALQAGNVTELAEAR